MFFLIIRKFCNRVHVKGKTWKHPDMRTREENEERNSVEGLSDMKTRNKRKALALQEQTQFQMKFHTKSCHLLDRLVKWSR